MAFEHRDNSGALFRNKKENDNQPDYTGEARIGGKVYRMAAWLKDGKKGKWMSFSFSDKADAPAKKRPEEIDDDIPW